MKSSKTKENPFVNLNVVISLAARGRNSEVTVICSCVYVCLMGVVLNCYNLESEAWRDYETSETS